MLSGIAYACGPRCNQEVEYLREPRAKHFSAYVFTCSLITTLAKVLTLGHFEMVYPNSGENGIRVQALCLTEKIVRGTYHLFEALFLLARTVTVIFAFKLTTLSSSLTKVLRNFSKFGKFSSALSVLQESTNRCLSLQLSRIFVRFPSNSPFSLHLSDPKTHVLLL